jgi:hypothetical protein
VRKIFSIVLLLCLFVQAIPVLQFAFKNKSLYSYVDEEKPEGKSKENKSAKNDHSEFDYSFLIKATTEFLKQDFYFTDTELISSPFLAKLTPPPNQC